MTEHVDAGSGSDVPWREAEAVGQMVRVPSAAEPEGEANPCQEGSPSMVYEYKMVQIPPNIEVPSKEYRGQEAAFYLQQTVNHWATQGWEFYRVDVVGVVTTPGCLGQLLGAKSTHLEYYVVTFRRPRPPVPAQGPPR